MLSRVATVALTMIATLLSVTFWFVVCMFAINAIDPPRMDDGELMVPLITSVEYFAMEKTLTAFVAGAGITAVFWLVTWFLQPERSTT